MDHPNILPLKDASFIDGRFVIASRLGEKNLGRSSQEAAFDRTALEFCTTNDRSGRLRPPHEVIHCDIKPENMILLPDGRLQLTDFRIAKIAQRTIHGSGSGTVGYMALNSDGASFDEVRRVSLGLIMCKMLTGYLPEWPFDWPFPGNQTLKRKAHPELIELLRKTLEIRPIVASRINELWPPSDV